VHPSWTRAVASPRIYDDLGAAPSQNLSALPRRSFFLPFSLLHIGVIPLLAGYDGVILKTPKRIIPLRRLRSRPGEWRRVDQLSAQRY